MTAPAQPIVYDVVESLNEYFKLKNSYETQYMAFKRKIINNNTLNNKDKKKEFLKLKPKCINCKRPGGTRFQTIYFEETDTVESYKQYTAICGIISNPCSLNIKIHIGKTEQINEILISIENEIKEYKRIIINNKNKLLFGYLTTEQALTNFDEIKSSITVYTSLYIEYLEQYNKIFDNTEKNEELNQAILNSYTQINLIKNCIKQMNLTQNIQYAKDAVNIYNNELLPLLNIIRDLKYNENIIYNDDNMCNLIQHKHSIASLSYTMFENKVIEFNIGNETIPESKTTEPDELPTSSETTSKKPIQLLKSPKILKSSLFKSSTQLKKPKKPTPVIPATPATPETPETPSPRTPVTPATPVTPVTPVIHEPIVRDQPNYGQPADDINSLSWNIPQYTQLWNKLPIKLKNALINNHEWLVEFMFNCVNATNNETPCTFTAPPNIEFPPFLSISGNYNFNNPIYNAVFNKLNQTLKDKYLTYFNIDDTGERNYTRMRNIMNELVRKELDFNQGVF